MKKTFCILFLLLLFGFRIMGQTPSPTINGTPPPFVFTGGGVSQTGQTFTFTSGSPSGSASGDLSGNYPAPTVAGLGGIPFTNVPTPGLSDVICYDGVQYTPCPPTAGAAQILYLTNTASDVGSYFLWDTSPLGGQFTVPVTIPATTTKTLLNAFATTSGYPNVTVIPAGEWQADSYVQVSSASNTTTLNIDVYDRTSGGVETLLFSFTNATISGNGTAIQHISSEIVEPAFAILASDRLVIKYSMTKTGGASITGTLYGGGSANYSHVHTPIGSASGVGGITGIGTKGPVCADATGNLYIGNNTGVGAPCP